MSYGYADYLESGEVKDGKIINPSDERNETDLNATGENEFTAGYTNEDIRNSLGGSDKNVAAGTGPGEDDGYDYNSGYGY